MWLTLVLSMPTENTTARTRVWRHLKSLGAVAIRDGVYLLPDREELSAALMDIAHDVEQNQGCAHVLRTAAMTTDHYADLFVRDTEWAELEAVIEKLRHELLQQPIDDSLKQLRKLRKSIQQLIHIDFFPNHNQSRVIAALHVLEQQAHQRQSQGEPSTQHHEIKRLDVADYQGRVWATRARPWVDRLASAWLIERWIDQQATWLWLDQMVDVPTDVVGFDFDGAAFSHVADWVTFEVLMQSFGLQTPELMRMAQIIHALDVGGLQPVEAEGLEQILKRLCQQFDQDDQLIQATHAVFDSLYLAFQSAGAS